MRPIPQIRSRPRTRRYYYTTFIFLIVLFSSAAIVVAVPLAVYRERVHNSVIKLDSLQTIGEDTVEEEHEELIAQTLKEVRLLMPASEKAESGEFSIEIDNKWLEAALNEYEELSGSSDKRRDLLTQTTERLLALEEALAELDNESANQMSKEESKARMSNILRRDEYLKKSSEGSALARLWRRIGEWLRGLFPETRQMSPGRANVLSLVAQIIVIGLALGVIAFVAWKLWPRIWRSSVKSKKGGKREARVVLGERLEADQTSADLLAEAERLAREGNLRGAIRKGYIALLCELGDRKVLGLAQHKTNRDYLKSVQSHEQLHREMQFLTYSFEHHWYGFVPANTDDWNLFRARYHQALRQG